MAQKKFFTKEVKIGISFILALTILIVGINFLKGINLFTMHLKSTNTNMINVQ